MASEKIGTPFPLRLHRFVIRRFSTAWSVCAAASVLASSIDDQIPNVVAASHPSSLERRHGIVQHIFRELGELQSVSGQASSSSPMSWSGVQITGIT